jgi:hypothetical protein
MMSLWDHVFLRPYKALRGLTLRFRNFRHGVKDKTALFWIDQLIVKARDIQEEWLKQDAWLKDKNLKGDARKAVKTRIKDLIQWELYNWVICQPEDRWSKLPKNSGEQLCCCFRWTAQIG